MNGPYPPLPPPNGMHAGPGAGFAPPNHRPPMMPSYSTSSTLPLRTGPGYAPPNPINGANGPPFANNNSADTRTQLFVSNLPFRVRWQDLVRDLFEDTLCTASYT